MSLDETTLTEVLKDVLEQQEKNQKVIQNLEIVLGERDQVIATLSDDNRKLIASFEEKYKKIEIKAPVPDLTPVHRELHAGMSNFVQVLEKKPMPIVRQFRFLFFPENNPEKFYRIVAGHIIPWTFGFIVAMGLIPVGRKWAEGYEAKQHSRSRDIAAAAWIEAYESGNAAMQKKLKKAYAEAEKKY
ncbi:hypothetical protein HDC92_004789 [Pedobacter sp. AK017]|uniref:hypothetical protein n=1 Tax=Pedobacter sp. AK017 TaxID=2723073 RepID=UPI0016076B72|nr:hypothetical protein [Pedobacter sp. AK017]MBB5441084.1 hypothetical protein [Pedobacter sp. AK017]